MITRWVARLHTLPITIWILPIGLLASFLLIANLGNQLLGHKTLAMTLRYSHLSKSHTRNALSVLDAAIN